MPVKIRKIQGLSVGQKRKCTTGFKQSEQSFNLNLASLPTLAALFFSYAFSVFLVDFINKKPHIDEPGNLVKGFAKEYLSNRVYNMEEVTGKNDTLSRLGICCGYRPIVVSLIGVSALRIFNERSNLDCQQFIAFGLPKFNTKVD
jgi:hypothetical protein